MAAVDKQVPYLPERTLQVELQPAGTVVTQDNPNAKIPLTAMKLPKQDLKTLNEDILNKARAKFKNYLLGTMYPFGFDLLMREMHPNVHTGDFAKGTGLNLRVPFKDRMWRKAYRRIFKRTQGMKPSESELPPRPKMSSYIKAKGGADGEMMIEEVDPFKEGLLYTTEGLGKKCAKGGQAAILSALGTSAMSMLPEMIASGIASIVEAFKGIRKHKKEEGSGVKPTPYQVEQATKAAKQAQERGVIGMPNPLALPKYPKMKPHPIPPAQDGITMMRNLYNAATRAAHGIAARHGIPPEVSIPAMHKFVRRHAKERFGSGAAKIILNTPFTPPPMKVPTLANLLAPFIHLRKPGPRKEQLLAALKHRALNRPLRGTGIGDIFGSIADFLLGPRKGEEVEAPKKLPHYIKKLPKKLAKYMKKKIKRIFKNEGIRRLEEPEEEMTDIDIESILRSINPALVEYSQEPAEEYPWGKLVGEIPAWEGYEGYGKSRDIDVGSLYAIAGGKIGKKIKAALKKSLPVLKKIGRTVIQVGAPILGAFVGSKVKDPSVAKSIREAGKDLAEIMGEKAEVEEWKEAKEGVIEKAKQEQKEALEEYKKARELSPDEYSKLRQEAEYARQVHDLLASAEAPMPSLYDPTAALTESMTKHSLGRKYRMVPSETRPGHMRREYGMEGLTRSIRSEDLTSSLLEDIEETPKRKSRKMKDIEKKEMKYRKKMLKARAKQLKKLKKKSKLPKAESESKEELELEATKAMAGEEAKAAKRIKKMQKEMERKAAREVATEEEEVSKAMREEERKAAKKLKKKKSYMDKKKDLEDELKSLRSQMKELSMEDPEEGIDEYEILQKKAAKVLKKLTKLEEKASKGGSIVPIKRTPDVKLPSKITAEPVVVRAAGIIEKDMAIVKTTKPFHYKAVNDATYGSGKTSADIIRSHRKADQVLRLVKKMDKE